MNYPDLTVELLQEVESLQEKEKVAWVNLLDYTRQKNLLPGLDRDAIEAALKIGFERGWALRGEVVSRLPMPEAKSSFST